MCWGIPTGCDHCPPFLHITTRGRSRTGGARPPGIGAARRPGCLCPASHLPPPAMHLTCQPPPAPHLVSCSTAGSALAPRLPRPAGSPPILCLAHCCSHLPVTDSAQGHLLQEALSVLSALGAQPPEFSFCVLAFIMFSLCLCLTSPLDRVPLEGGTVAQPILSPSLGDLRLSSQ